MSERPPDSQVVEVEPLPRLPPSDQHRPPAFVDGRRHLLTRDEYLAQMFRYGFPGPVRRTLELLGTGISDETWAELEAERHRIVARPQMQNLGSLSRAMTTYRMAADYGGHDELAALLRERELWLQGLYADGEVPPELVRAHACALVDVGSDCPMRAWPGCDTAVRITELAEAACADPSIPPVLYNRTLGFNTPPPE